MKLSFDLDIESGLLTVTTADGHRAREYHRIDTCQRVNRPHGAWFAPGLSKVFPPLAVAHDFPQELLIEHAATGDVWRYRLLPAAVFMFGDRPPADEEFA
jgi:hypothetical protein